MHSDENASMKILADLNNEELFCYSCHASGDIFTVNHWLHGADLTGYSFIKENLYQLADKYSIPYEEIQLTPEQLDVLDRVKVNKFASQTLVKKDDRGRPINWTNKHTSARGWNDSVCQTLRVSTVEDYNRFLLDVSRNTGVDPADLQDKYGITSDLFGPNYITISLFDERGQVVGFISRNLKWTKGSKVSKYTNTHNNPAFTKSKVLYGMHLVRSSKGRRLDIFEGNGSFITAFGAGHNSCVSISGSKLSQHQADLIERMGFTHVNISLDGDSTGKQKTSDTIEMLSGREGLKVTCTWMKDGYDPDDFIQENGLEGFYKLKTQTAFSFFLDRDAETAKRDNLEKFISKMIRVIQNTANRIERGQQLDELAKAVDVPAQDIRDEMERIERTHVENYKGQLAREIRSARDTDELLSVLDSTGTNIRETAGTQNERLNLSPQESLENFEDLVTILKNQKVGLQGWKTGFSILDLKLSGIPKPVGKDEEGNDIPIPGMIMGLAGGSQHGKSTILQNLVLNLAKLNEDITVLYWALDDSRELVMQRLISIDSGVSWAAVTKRIERTAEEERLINESISRFRLLIVQGKFVMKDQSNGSTIAMAKRWVETMQKEHKRPVCLVIDSFHKIGSSGEESNLTENARTKRHCEELKTFYKTHKITIIASLELNKGAMRGKEPDMLNITESRKIEYDFDVIATVFNHYFDMDGDSNQVLYQGGRSHPFIKVNLRKSKNGGSGPIYFALNPTNFNIKAYTVEEMQNLTASEQVKDRKVPGATIVSPESGGLKPKVTVATTANKKEPWL